MIPSADVHRFRLASIGWAVRLAVTLLWQLAGISGRGEPSLAARSGEASIDTDTTVEYHPPMSTDEVLEQYEKSLGLPGGFINSLKGDGDDWSFTIKAHALIETGLTEAIRHSIGKPSLDDMLVKLPITGQFSKLAICRELNLFQDSGETEQFVVVLGSIRNRLVHNIKRVEFSLDDYFTQLHQENASEFERQRRCLDLVFGDANEVVEVRGQRVTTSELFRMNARLMIFSSLGMVLGRIHVVTGVARATQSMRETADKLFTKVFVEQLLEERAAKTSEAQAQSQ